MQSLPGGLFGTDARASLASFSRSLPISLPAVIIFAGGFITIALNKNVTGRSVGVDFILEYELADQAERSDC